MTRTLTALLALLLLLPGAVTAQEEVDFSKLKRGRWKPRHVPHGFFAKRFKRYQFQSDWDQDVIKKLAVHMNAMFKVYRKFAPPKKTPTDLLVIKIFKDRKGFRGYGARPGAAGYYSHRNKEMVGYNTGLVAGVSTVPATTGNGGRLRARLRAAYSLDVLGVFSHEGWHQYFHWTCGSLIPFPSWLDEGIGDYFYTAYPDKSGKIVLGAPMDKRLGTIQGAIAGNRHVPLEKMVHFEQREYYRNAGQNYAQGWSMVYFFMEHPDYKKKRTAQRFVKIFTDQHSIKKTVKFVFPKKTKWKRLENDWKNWIMSIPRIVNPDDPMAGLAEKSNKRAGEFFKALPPHVQKALRTCVEKGAARPGSKGKLPDWITGDTKQADAPKLR